MRRCRAATRSEQEILDSDGGASDERLHGAVAAVAHPSIEMKPPSLAGDEDAVTYPLHTPVNEYSGDPRFCDFHVSLK